MSNDSALAAFLTQKAKIDTALARLAELSESHFDTMPDNVNWADVGSLAGIADLLQQATDAAFCEGEHA